MTTAPTPQVTQGTLDRVPCPHCGKTNDFRAIKEYDQMLEVGSSAFCDHCDRSMLIVRVQPVTLVAVRKDPSGKVAPREQQVQPARTMSAAMAAKLLGRGR